MVISCLWGGRYDYRDSGMRVEIEAAMREAQHAGDSRYSDKYSEKYREKYRDAFGKPATSSSTSSASPRHVQIASRLEGYEGVAVLPAGATPTFVQSDQATSSSTSTSSPASEAASSLAAATTPASDEAAAPLRTLPTAADIADLPAMPTRLLPTPDQMAQLSRQVLASSFPYLQNAPTNWSQLGLILTTSVFAMMFQHSVPGIVHPLRSKRHAPRVFAVAVTVVLTIYISLSTLAAAYFGSKALPAINLNWDPALFKWKPSSPSSVYAPKHYRAFERQVKAAEAARAAAEAARGPHSAAPALTQEALLYRQQTPLVSTPIPRVETPLFPLPADYPPAAAAATATATPVLASRSSSGSGSGKAAASVPVPAPLLGTRFLAAGERWAWAAWGAFLSVISMVIYLFPPIDVVSVYPLTAVTLGNSLQATAPAWLVNRTSPARVKVRTSPLAVLPSLSLFFPPID